MTKRLAAKLRHLRALELAAIGDVGRCNAVFQAILRGCTKPADEPLAQAIREYQEIAAGWPGDETRPPSGAAISLPQLYDDDWAALEAMVDTLETLRLFGGEGLSYSQQVNFRELRDLKQSLSGTIGRSKRYLEDWAVAEQLAFRELPPDEREMMIMQVRRGVMRMMQ